MALTKEKYMNSPSPLEMGYLLLILLAEIKYRDGTLERSSRSWLLTLGIWI